MPRQNINFFLRTRPSPHDTSSRTGMTSPDEEAKAVALENESVHRVYDIIAPHFSDTRYNVLSLPPKRTTHDTHGP